MKRLTDEELTQIKERAEKASEGPWDVDVPVDYCANCENGYEIVQSELFLAPIVAELKNREDAEFIAHAREDIPKLITEIEALRTENQRYRKALEEIRNKGTYELNNALKTDCAWIADEALEVARND